MPNELMNIFGIRLEFILFSLILIGVALFNKKAFWIAFTGLIVILVYKLVFDSGFSFFEHFLGNNSIIEQLLDKHQRQGEWSLLLNLFGLLLGFEILSQVFHDSKIPDILPHYLPDNWKGPFVLLIFVAVLSAFLDNIAAAMIGGTIAAVVFNKKVHIGYLAAIVAASNAGGAGSVIGDTTTTMMWIEGVAPMDVLHAFIGSGFAIVIFGTFASLQQHKYQKIVKDIPKGIKVDFVRLGIVIIILIGAVITNILFDLPFLGVWIALLIGSFVRKIPWNESKHALSGTLFLLCLVTSASLMPVNSLPGPSWHSVFGFGFVSAVFDNIPLTKLCLEQGGYDWGLLAYAVGFGGSMIWFGSSAGVALTNEFPDARNVLLWIRKAWYIPLAYVIGFFLMLSIMGWNPQPTKTHKNNIRQSVSIIR